MPALTRSNMTIFLKVNFLHQGEIFICCRYYLRIAFKVAHILCLCWQSFNTCQNLSFEIMSKAKSTLLLFKQNCVSVKLKVCQNCSNSGWNIHASYLIQSEIKPHREMLNIARISWKQGFTKIRYFFIHSRIFWIFFCTGLDFVHHFLLLQIYPNITQLHNPLEIENYEQPEFCHFLRCSKLCKILLVISSSFLLVNLYILINN